jgi:hypothetical protein
MSKARITSLLLGAFAWLAPPLYAFFRLRAMGTAMPGPRCGMPELGVILLAVMTTLLTSFLACVCGIVDYWRLPKPRPWSRRLELTLLFMPILMSGALMVTFAWG